jgi:hypothetical protein
VVAAREEDEDRSFARRLATADMNGNVAWRACEDRLEHRVGEDGPTVYEHQVDVLF